MKMKMRPKVIMIALTVGILTLSLWKITEAPKRADLYESLASLPGFDVRQVKGQYFLIHFWAKWCEPCADEIPHLVEFSGKPGFQKPLKVIAISLDPNLDEARAILPEKGLHLPPNFILALDSERKIAEKLGSFQYPETYFVDPQGTIIEKWVGPQKWNKPEVFEFFRQKLL